MNGTWAADPWQRHPYRWFDGTTWTALVFDGRMQFLDPYVVNVRTADQMVGANMPAMAGISAGATQASTLPAPAAPPAPSPPPPATISTAAMPVMPAAPQARPVASAVVPEASAATPLPTQPTQPTQPTSKAVRSSRQTGLEHAKDEVAVGGMPSTGRIRRQTRPRWVPFVGAALVCGFAWWLFGLRSSDSGTPVAADDAAMQIDSADDVPSTLASTDATPSVPTPSISSSEPVEPASPPVAAEMPDPVLVQDCVEHTPFAAYVGDDAAIALWSAAGFDTEVLHSLCSALPTWRLGAIATQRDEMDLFLTGTLPAGVTTTPTTPTTSIPAVPAVPPVTSPDGASVPVSPTMPPPLPTTSTP